MLEPVAVGLGGAALLLSLAGTLQAARAAQAPLAAPGGWRPAATVIVPCKGHHPGFEDNVRALASQDYPRYDLVFVVDDLDDPCARALAALPGLPLRVVVAEPDAVGRDWATGKIVAQLTGVRHAAPGSEVLVFADADARPPAGWLAALVAPLEDAGVGAATGYRWYMAATRATPWTALRDAWNAVGLDAMTMPRLRFLWGGSMAVRRRDFERAPVAEHWRRTVSEDVGLTRAVQSLGLGIAFAPGALVASREDWSREEVLEWVVRQAALTRASMPRLFRFAEGVYAGSAALFLGGLALATLAPTPTLRLAGLALLGPVLSAPLRAWFRERGVRRALPQARSLPRRERALQLGLSLVLPGFMLWVLLRARRTHTIAWRGRSYRLLGADT